MIAERAIKFTLTSQHATTPTICQTNSSAIKIFSAADNIIIPPGGTCEIDTDIIIHTPQNTWLQLIDPIGTTTLQVQ